MQRDKVTARLEALQKHHNSVKEELAEVLEKYAKSQAEADVNRSDLTNLRNIKDKLDNRMRCARPWLEAE